MHGLNHITFARAHARAKAERPPHRRDRGARPGRLRRLLARSGRGAAQPASEVPVRASEPAGTGC